MPISAWEVCAHEPDSSIDSRFVPGGAERAHAHRHLERTLRRTADAPERIGTARRTEIRQRLPGCGLAVRRFARLEADRCVQLAVYRPVFKRAGRIERGQRRSRAVERTALDPLHSRFGDDRRGEVLQKE